jgi:hypothetical protein
VSIGVNMRAAAVVLGLAFAVAACGGAGAVPNASSGVSTPVAADPTQTRTSPRPVAAPAEVTYENCDAVRAAGAAPIHVGDPGYSKKLDRDGDGIGCE